MSSFVDAECSDDNTQEQTMTTTIKETESCVFSETTPAEEPENVSGETQSQLKSPLTLQISDDDDEDTNHKPLVINIKKTEPMPSTSGSVNRKRKQLQIPMTATKKAKSVKKSLKRSREQDGQHRLIVTPEKKVRLQRFEEPTLQDKLHLATKVKETALSMKSVMKAENLEADMTAMIRGPCPCSNRIE